MLARIPFSFLAGNPLSGLDLSGWYQEWLGAVDWFSSPSAGTSGARKINSASNAPGSGTLNGHSIITFDGINQNIADSAVTAASYITVAAYTQSILCRPKNPQIPTGAPFAEPMIIGENNATFGIDWTTSGISAWQYDGGYKTTPYIATVGNTWNVIDVKYDGITLECRVNGSVWSQIAAGNITTLAGSTFRVGRGYGAASFAEVDVAEFITSQIALTDGQLNAVRAYWAGKYGVAV